MRRLVTILMTFALISGWEVQAQIDITYCRAHWSFSPDAVYISGAVTTHFKSCASAVGKIDFDLSNHLRVDSVLQGDKRLTFKHKSNSLMITLPANVEAGVVDSVTIYYHGKPVPTGFGSIGLDKINKAVWTISEPYGGRDWWPCRQNLLDKIDSMDIYVTCPTKYKVASNGKLMGYKEDGNSHTAHYKQRHPANYYTVAIAVGDFNTAETKAELTCGDTVEITDYYLPSMEYADKNLRYISNFMDFFSNYWTPYPFADEKYGQVYVNAKVSIEHQTMSFLAYSDIGVMAHELAHQWFGNYVTCSGWRNLWVNEAFATFAELMIIERFYSDLAIEWKKFTLQNALTAKRAIFNADTTNAHLLFDVATIYNKSALTLLMLRNEIGNEAFQRGGRMIIEQYANGFATIDDARKCFETAADTSLVDFFDKWTNGIGYPIYTVKCGKTENGKTTINIKQTTSNSSVSFYPLHVTVRLIGKDDQQKDVRLHHISPKQDFVVETDFNVEDIVFDPECDILCKWSKK